MSPTSDLVATRIELHWAAQVLSAAADAWLPARADDGHTAMRWEHHRLVGEVGLALDVDRFALVAPTAELALSGVTLADAMAWADRQLGAPRGIHARAYDMPPCPPRFAGDRAQLAELARWYDLGHAVLSAVVASSAIRVWPHHFDLGAILYLDDAAERSPQARQIGIGLSPGDRWYAEPYLYVTPSPLAAGATFPALDGGGVWRRDGWTGAVLVASAIARSSDAQAHAFMRSAIAGARGVIA